MSVVTPQNPEVIPVLDTVESLPISRAMYNRMIDAGVFEPDTRAELIDGRIVKMSPIGPRHELIVAMLDRWVQKRLDDQWMVFCQGPLAISGMSEPEPDLYIARFSPETYRSEKPTAADTILIIEVAESSLHRDLHRKRDLYATAGMPEYWVVDLVEDRLHVHREPDRGRYTSVRIVGKDDPVAMPGIDEPFRLSDVMR